VCHHRDWCYTSYVPTSKPRHVITETEQVARALDDAARRWPHDGGSRGKLLVHLVQEGHRALLADAVGHLAARRESIERTSGILAGTYEPGYLEHLRDEWPP